MKKAGDKLYSQRGATLMMALLLFLICAVLGSVVLVAGTAAAGRLSELSKMEQRYYAVTSAANLLREKLCTDEGVEVVCKKSTKTSRAITYNGDGTISFGQPSKVPEQASDYVWPEDAASDTLGDRLARYVVFGDPAASYSAKWELCSGKSEPTGVLSLPDIGLTVKRGDPAAEDEGLTVKVKATLNPDRTVTLEIANVKDSDKAKYTLTMTLTPVLERKRSETVSTEVVGTNEITTTSETMTVKVIWSVSAIQTMETQAAGGGSGA